MNNVNTKAIIQAIVDRFLILAEEFETPGEMNTTEETAPDYFKQIWLNQNELSRQALKKIVKDISYRPHVCDAIV